MKRKFVARLTALVISCMLIPLSSAMGSVGIIVNSMENESISDLHSELVINEVCSSNKHSLIAEDGTSPDWIEIFNSGDADIDMSGIGLSDGKKNRYKYVFPENTLLSAREYIIILCDGTNSHDTEEHAAFNISASGETIYLTAVDGNTIDNVTVPALNKDTAYGRYPDGSDSFALLNPSPGTSNDTADVLNYVKEPVFSAEGGFYDNAFDLSLSAEVNNTILYTLDGSDPRTSETAIQYQNDIKIYDNTHEPNVLSAIKDISLGGYTPPDFLVDKGICVRAVSKNSDGAFSKVVTNNYFVGKTVSYYTDMKVLAISTESGNFFDKETGIYVIGNQYERWKNSEDYDPNLNVWSSQNPTNYNMQGKEWERPCNIQVFEQGELKYTENVGVRVSGNWSATYPQKSLTFYARNEYGASKMSYDFFGGKAKDMYGDIINEFKKVTLRNGGNDYLFAHIRDELNQSLAENLHFGSQAKENYIVFLDGEFWGYYSMQEKLDKNYIESHYHIDCDEVTTIKNGVADDGQESTYTEWLDFWNWAKNADMSDDSNYQRVCSTIDITSLMEYISFQSYIVNRDCLINPNNWMIWRTNYIDQSNPYADGKYRFLLYDTDNSINMSEASHYSVDCFEKMDKSWKVISITSLFCKLLDNSSFKESFYTVCSHIYENHFNKEIISDKIDQYVDSISEAITDTIIRFHIGVDFMDEIAVIRDFFNKRSEYAFLYLKQIYDIDDDNSNVTTTNPPTQSTTTATSTESTTTFTTANTTESTSISMSNYTTSSVISSSVTTTTANMNIASNEELCNWSVKHYQDKTGTTDVNAEITSISDDKYEITLTDNKGSVVDVYLIDPITGVGTNSDKETVDLPQTGNNSMINWLIFIGGLVLIGFGFFAVKSSGIGKWYE